MLLCGKSTVCVRMSSMYYWGVAVGGEALRPAAAAATANAAAAAAAACWDSSEAALCYTPSSPTNTIC